MATDPTVAAVAGLLTGWTAAGSGSLARRLAHGLRGAVLTGALEPGARLPAERPLSAGLAVSRATLVAALDELRADGLLDSRRGSGTRVATPPAAPTVGPGRPGGAPGRASMVDHLLAHGGIDLAVAAPHDASHLPDLAVTTADLVSAVPAHGYEPVGLPALRDGLADRLARQGLPSTTGSVQITHGAQQALALAVGALVGPGDVVLVEAPTYPGILDVLAERGARPVVVAGDDDGPDPGALARALADPAVRLAYLQPVVDNPTGRVVTARRRDAIADVFDESARRREPVVVVEDLVLAELVHDGGSSRGLAARCRSTPVVSVGSLSKIAWGGLRIGWLRAPHGLSDRILRTRHASDLGAALPSQLLALRLLPELDAIVEARRSHLAERAALGAALLATALPDWEVVAPRGGLALWARLPVADTGPLTQLAHRHGVRVAPGGAAAPSGGPDPHVRVCVDRPVPQLEEGVRRLARAWQELTARDGPSSPELLASLRASPGARRRAGVGQAGAQG